PRQAVTTQVYIIDKKENDATAIRRGVSSFFERGQSCRVSLARSRQLSFFSGTTGGDFFEERKRLELRINPQLKIIGSQAVDEMPMLIDHRQVRLHQLGLNADHIV